MGNNGCCRYSRLCQSLVQPTTDMDPETEVIELEKEQGLPRSVLLLYTVPMLSSGHSWYEADNKTCSCRKGLIVATDFRC